MPHLNKDHNMPYIVNGNTVSKVSDAEFECIKKREIEKLNKELLPMEITFAILFSVCIIFLLCYGFYDVIHNGYVPPCTCICH